ncbi:hypothetical protein Y696_02590 [Mesotoga sp. H07pep.5.4]|uniref:hypothetical protein n=1 Tax=Mesotoga sp. H07pep.5.4 TaxID=1463664 RepID=UPI000EF13304|nr:hypothetical protein [Mesotoga sp. H07pep.5.4]RLL86987.1 hypothetical protein Y696_02590 [Mesotoga sp. H07pep.5.4]
MKRVTFMLLIAIAVVILLSACPSVAKTRSLVGTWNLSVIKSESETFTAFMQITTHEKGNLSGYLGNDENYGTISGTTSKDNISFLYSSYEGGETIQFTGKFDSVGMTGTATVCINSSYKSGPHDWTAQRTE